MMNEGKKGFWETRTGQFAIYGSLLCGSAFIAFFWNGRRSFWLDEALTVRFALLSPGKMIEALRYDTGSPFYYLLVRYWMKVFGSGESAVRGLSGLFYVGGVLAVYGFTKRLYRATGAGLAAALLLMFSWEAIRHAANARNYSLMAFLGILSVSLYLRVFFRGGGRADTFAYVLVNAAGIYSNYAFAMLLSAQVLAVLLLDARRSLGKCITLMIASCVPFLPYLPEVLQQIRNRGLAWMEPPGFADLPMTFAHFYSGGQVFLPILVYGFVLATLFISFEGRRFSWRKMDSLREYFSLAERRALLLLPPLILTVLMIISQYKPIYMVGRQSILVLVPTVLLIGPFLALNNRRATLAVFFTLLGLGMTEEILLARSRTPRFSDRKTAAYLAENASPDDLLIFVGLSGPSLEYYLGRFQPEEKKMIITFPGEISRHPGWMDESTLLERRGDLVDEAERIVGGLAQSMYGTNRSLWVVYDNGRRRVSGVLRKAIEGRFTLTEKAPIRSFFCDGIYRYQCRETGSGGI